MENSKVVLAIETSTKIATISILRDGIEIGFKKLSENESASELLLAKISELLLENTLELANISLIVVSKGPGSLTGIRVGIAVAKGLALALGIKCLGVSLLESMASFDSLKKNICCLVSAGGINYYWQFFEDANISEIKFGNIDEFKSEIGTRQIEVILVDKIASDKILGDAFQFITIENLAQIVGKKGINLDCDLAKDSLVPIYGRETIFNKMNLG